MKKLLCVLLALMLCVISVLQYGITPVYAQNFTDMSDEDIDNIIDLNQDFSTTYNGKIYEFKKLDNGGWICFNLPHQGVWRNNDRLKEFLKADNVIDNITAWVNNQNWSAQLQIAIGFITQSPDKILEGIVNDMTITEVESVFKEHTTIDNSCNITMDSYAINKIKEYLQKKYLNDNGIYSLPVVGKNIQGLSLCKGGFEYEEDYTEFLATADLYDYLLIMSYPMYTPKSANREYQGEGFVCIGLDKEDFNQFYFSDFGQYTRYGITLCNADKDLKGKVFKPKVLHMDNVYNYFPGSYPDPLSVSDILGLCYYTGNSMTHEFDNKNTFDYLVPIAKHPGYSDYDTAVTEVVSSSNSVGDTVKLQLYSNKYGDISVFKDYEALYNYTHGEGTYIASKFYQNMEHLQITQNDLTSEICTKMDDIYNAISSGALSVTNSQELQDLIDKTIDNLDKITDESGKANMNLESIIEILTEQNQILMEMLDVTYSIDKSLNNIEAMTAIDLLTTIFSDFNRCTEQLKTSFPFSLPYDLILVYDVLRAEPVAPAFTMDFNPILSSYTGGEKKEDLVVIIDLSMFKDLSTLSRTLLSLLFVCNLIHLSRKMFFKGGKVQ